MLQLIKYTTVMAIALFALAGCGGGSGSEDTSADGYSQGASPTLYYSYPMDGAQNVAPRAPMVLTFMSGVTADASDFTLKSDNGTNIKLAVEVVNDGYHKLVKHGSSVVLRVQSGQPLATNTTYTLTSDKFVLPGAALSFTTRPALAGATASMATDSATFKVVNMTPDGHRLPFVDFSTIDLLFSQPIDPASAHYGASVTLKQNGKLVPATLLVSGRKMTLDPVGLLQPQVPVVLEISHALQSQLLVPDGSGAEQALQPFKKTLNPLGSEPRTNMVQRAPVASKTSAGCADSNALTSALTGMAINCVPVVAKLLGDTTESGQMGNIYAQLAFAPNFALNTASKGKIPLRIKKGALLNGSALSVNIGGQVPAGFNSGAVTVTFMSDANGYLLPNPYTSNPNAPRRLILTSDMAFDTADPRANGAFTQNLLHVTLVGSAIADPKKGILKVDAVGVVEPSVLGLEHAYGVLSFHMDSYADQTHLGSNPDNGKPVAAEQPVDDRQLTLISWVPGTQARSTTRADGAVKQQLAPVKAGDAQNVADMLRPGDPIVLSFNKPLDKNSIAPGQTVSLTLNSAPVDFDWRLSGSSLSLYPQGGLEYSTQDTADGVIQAHHAAVYQVSYTSGLTDLAGKMAATGGKTLTFTMPLYADVDAAGNNGAGHSPVVTSMYPGFPCVNTDVQLPDNQGYCQSKPKDGEDGSRQQDGDAVDRLPVMPLPANRSIHVLFSQVMMAPSIRLGDTFLVQACESASSCQDPQPVKGRLTLGKRALTFTPRKPWQAGTLYRYTLKSAAHTLGDGVCKGAGAAICSVGQHPLKTAPLIAALGYNDGGPALTNYFVGAVATANVLQLLGNFPTSDVDASLKHDVGELQPYDDSGQLVNPRAQLNSAHVKVLGVADSQALKAANVGCGIGDVCPNGKYLYMTGSLMADIVGFKTAAQIQSLVEAGAFPEEAVPDDLKTAGVISKGAVLAYIYPTQIIASSITTYTDPAIGNAPPAATGAQVMRIRYTCDAAKSGGCDNAAHGRVPGWIVAAADPQTAPSFYTNLDLYMDAPQMQASVAILGITTKLSSNLHNYPLVMHLKGPLTFLPDGRLQISQISQNKSNLNIVLGGVPLGLSAKVNLAIPAGATNLNYVGAPIEN